MLKKYYLRFFIQDFSGFFSKKMKFYKNTKRYPFLENVRQDFLNMSVYDPCLELHFGVNDIKRDIYKLLKFLHLSVKICTQGAGCTLNFNHWASNSSMNSINGARGEKFRVRPSPGMTICPMGAHILVICFRGVLLVSKYYFTLYSVRN